MSKGYSKSTCVQWKAEEVISFILVIYASFQTVVLTLSSLQVVCFSLV